MLAFKLAYRNLLGAGLRTWLNVAVLSLIYVLIIWHQGLFMGMLRQAANDSVKDEIAGGQYWHKDYDPYDPLSIDDANDLITGSHAELIRNKEATAILIRTASIFPKGRMQTVLLKGIDPAQEVLGIPSAKLNVKDTELPILIGERMANMNSFKAGDSLTIRWRDRHGTFDAKEGRIVGIMHTNIPTVDSGQLWISLVKLQEMTGLKDHATMIVMKQKSPITGQEKGWIFRDKDYLLKDFYDMIKSKRVSALIMYVILLFLAMLAIFDTQVLSIWKRKKEIGTLMALGMTRLQVITVFTVEGMMNGILAMIAGAIYGIPLLLLTAANGIPISKGIQQYGFVTIERLMPVYPIGLIVGTTIIIMLTVTIVSYLPARDISKLKPTEALRGKIS